MNHPPSECPACQTIDPVPINTGTLTFKGGLTLPLLQCRRCGHRWMHTTESDQRRIEENYHADYAGFRADEYFRTMIAAELKTRLTVLTPPPAAVLDVGCGNGDFLSLARDAGYACHGIDISKAAEKIGREKGLDVVAADFLQHDFKRSFDLITMWDVVEHLQKPRAFLQRAHALLNPKGRLLLKIPSFGGLNFQVLRLLPGRSPSLLGAPDHVQYFNPQSLRLLLASAGFAEALWFPPMRFRSQPETHSLKKRISRLTRKTIGRLAGNANLYVLAAKSRSDGNSPVAPGLLRREVLNEA